MNLRSLLRTANVEADLGRAMLDAPQGDDHTSMPPPPQAFNPVELVAEALDADIFIHSGEISRATATLLLDSHEGASKRENAVLVLSTYGGDPDAAFTMARFLKRNYKRFILFVFGQCKSAGTLVALGADEIVMADRGELGPLDVQLRRDDELGRHRSGLDIFQALQVINTQAFAVFENSFLELLQRSQGALTTRTAAEIATNLAGSLLKPITAQIDPLQLGEMQRAVSIARKYGELLDASATQINALISGYPSHSFVIDFMEAESLFGNVRKPETVEIMLEQQLRAELGQRYGHECIRTPSTDGIVGCITPLKHNTEGQNDDTAREHHPKAHGAGDADGAPDTGAAEGGEADAEEPQQDRASTGRNRKKGSPASTTAS